MKSTLKKLAAAACLGAGALLMGVGASTAAAVTSLPDGERLYIIESNDSFNDFRLFEIAPDGTATLIGNGTGSSPWDWAGQAAWDWETELAYFSSAQKLYSMDPSSGTASEIGVVSGDFAGDTVDVAIDDSGNAFAHESGKFGTLDLGTAATDELVGSSVNRDAGFYYFDPFAFNVNDGNFYTISADNTEDDGSPIDNKLYEFTGTSGDVISNPHGVLIGDGPVDSTEIQDFRSMSFDSNGVGWLLQNDGTVANLYTLDPTTATLDLVGPVTHNGSHIEVYSTFIAPVASSDSGSEGLAPTGGSATGALVAALLGAVVFGAGAMLRRRTHRSV